MTLPSSIPPYIFDFRSIINALFLTASHTIKMYKASGLRVLFSKCLNSWGDGVAPKYLVSFSFCLDIRVGVLTMPFFRCSIKEVV